MLNVWQPLVPPGATAQHRSNAATMTHWCPKWWDHPEAVNRIEALWRSWEDSRADPWHGMALWMRDQFDHHWPRLVGPGPCVFMYCDQDRHRPLGKVRAIPIGSHLGRPAEVDDNRA